MQFEYRIFKKNFCFEKLDAEINFQKNEFC